MVDYSRIADEACPDPEPAGPTAEPLSPNRSFLPLDHEKYQGIAAAKGYAQGEDFSGNRLKRVHYSHEAMIDVILTNPTMTQADLAKQFGKSQSWISIVMGSDAFQAALAKRRDDLADPFLMASINERLNGVVQQSLQVLASKLEQTQNPDLALKTLDIGVKALGLGARERGPVTNNFVVALPSKIQNPQDWAAAHARPVGPVIDSRSD